ncbi:DUF1800 family protein, partial [Arthrospira platensis SPKY1]|nr:DUF1800 family protein [Arthrospira platensis SPKY1]
MNQARHLVSRTHFGPRSRDVVAVLQAGSAAAAVDYILDRAQNTPLPDAPTWYRSGNSGNVLHMYSVQFEWMSRIYNGGLLERVMLFWSNHFAVSHNNMNDLRGKAPNSYASHMYDYSRLLHTHGLGDVRELVRHMSKNPAMLYYLNNYNNTPAAPNQDFARELMELFTMGPLDAQGNENYSEQDVEEVAKAVTGWRVSEATRTAIFDSTRFNAGPKTILGQTANFDLDGVIDLIFSQRQAQSAYFLANKLYA